MYVSRYKSTLLLSVLALMLAAPACSAGQSNATLGASATVVNNKTASLPADDMSVSGTKQIAGRTVYPEDNLTYDYDTFNFTVVNGRKSKEGYPVYAMQCDFRGDRHCYGEVGQDLGTINEVAAEMTTVSNKDVLRSDWYCDRVCVNSQNVIVGSVSPAMQAWLKRNPSTKKR